MGLKILIVEDNPLNLQLARDILELRGHEIEVAGDVAGGREQLGRRQFDIVLLDLQIPGGGGGVLLREILAKPTLARTSVIAVTAQAMEGDREEAIAAGFDGYISKPINVRTFGAEVEACAEKRRV